MRTLLVVCIIVVVPVAASAATWYVPDTYPTIQSAISSGVVVNGDVIIVRPGTYVENINFLGKAIIVKSEKGAWLTTIDGNQTGSVVTFVSQEGNNSVIEGFTITNGSGTDINPPGGWFCGGGIFCSYTSPTIRKNIITGNSVAFYGGGIYCQENSAPIISKNKIIENWSGDDGAGIGCWFCSTAPYPHISDNIIEYNMAVGCAGGIDCVESHCEIINNIIYKNIAGVSGLNANAGGIRCAFGSFAIITNNTVCDNFATYDGGGLESITGSSPTVTNCIFWNNTAMVTNVEISGLAVVTYSDVLVTMGVYPGAGNINANPLFMGPPDYHLTVPSPCIDSGNNAAPLIASSDFEGDPRCADVPSVPDTGIGPPPIVDMGADEFHRHLYLTGQTTPGGNVNMNFVGLPGTNIVGLVIGFNLFTPPLPSAYGLWYIAPPMIICYPLPPIPGNGVLVLTGTLPLAPPGPYTVYFQALIGPKLTNLWTMNVL